MPYFGRHRIARPGRKIIALVGTVAVVAGGVTATALVTGPQAQAASNGTVTGTAFDDYGYDGNRNQAGGASTIYDNGIPGVTVTVTDSGGATVGTATSTANGTYSVTVTNAATADVRVQFTPPTGYNADVHGAQSGSSVQFVQLGTASASNVDASFAHPGDYSQSAAPAILQVQEFGATSGAKNGPIIDQKTLPSLTSSPYTTVGTQQASQADITTRALMSQTGAVWGVAQSNQHFAFTAAHFRRHAFVGPGGLGAIYLTDLTSSSPNAASFVTIPNAGSDPRQNPKQGAMTSDDWFHDPQAFPYVGKIGLGGMAIAPDGSALFVANLNDKNIYRVPLTYAADGTPSAGTPAPLTGSPTALPGAATGCTAANTRPFGVSAQNGAIWVTETCTGPAAADLRGYVYRYDLGTNSFGSKPAFEMALSGYNRGQTYDGAQTAAWNAWSDTFGTVASNKTKNATMPQPLLSDVVFDYNGDMTIGVKDRFADEIGYQTGNTDSTSTTQYEGFAGGDQLRACGTEATGWTLENNATCGDRTGYTNTTNGNANGAGNNQGPGGGEFYSDNYANSHMQTALGGLLQVPGYPENVASSYDPGGAVRASGQRFQNNSNGQTGRYHTLQDTVNASATDKEAGSFGKAGGLGDLTALVADAPLEIGNRLWFDTDNDGIQDAGEGPVSGATVRLYAAGGTTAIATATTASDGTYYFSSGTGTSTASSRYGLALQPNTQYSVRVDNADDYASGGPLDGYAATKANVGSNREVDSNGLTTAQGTTTAAVTTGNAGAVDHSIDFGFVKPVSVGDFVFADTDRDGIQDAGEPGIANVDVSITKADGTAATHADGTAVPATTTDANGRYSFTDLSPGVAYKVSVTTPGGYVATLATQGNDRAKDSSTGSATTATLAAGASDTTLDFGFVKPAVSVGDYVFFDKNHNGIQDAGDTGIAGVRVSLSGPDGNAVTDINGATVGAVTTDSAGKYTFALLPVLPAGQHYTVNVNNAQTALLGAGYRPTRAQASGATTATDSSTTSATSTDLTSNGAADPTLDFGFVQSVNVGDFVWNDLDGDGIQDNNEPGIAGVQLTIVGPDGKAVTDTAGETVGAVTSDANGAYHFADLPVLAAGQSYTVKVDNSQGGLAGYKPTKSGQGTDTRVDSSTASAKSGDLTSADASDTTLDFGYVKPASVGDFVWRDTDRDGIQDAGEPGISGVVLTISRADGQPVVDADGTTLTGSALTRTTDAAGKYTFGNLAPGVAYTVTVTTGPSGLIATTAGAGGNRAVDSSTGSATSAVLASGGQDLGLDFGYVQPAVSVGDFVWRDRNRNGVQDTGERGLSGITVTLVGPSGGAVTDVYGKTVGAATTDANGKYVFNNLPALAAGQHYTVKIDNGQSALSGYIPTKTGQGTRDTDSETSSATSGDLTTDGSSDPTLDFGFVVPSVSVGDFVWEDRNGDGIQQVGDTGIANVTVTLVGPTGQAVTDVYNTAVAPARTDANGAYSFDNLPALATGQHYTVRIDNGQSALTGYVPTVAGAGTNRAVDSSTASAESADLTTQDDRDSTLDFGFVRPVSVGDFVWTDTNGDGIQQAGEPGIEGVKVALTNADGSAVTDVNNKQVTSTTTDANGRYEFDDLPPGRYTVTVTRPDGYAPTVVNAGNDRGADSSTGSVTTGTLSSGGSDDSADFGFVQPVTVGDLVWQDRNGNGVQDAGDPGIAGVTVSITNADGTAVTDLAGDPVSATTTDSDGKYAFGNLAPGQYKVTATTPPGYVATLANSPDATPATDSSTGTATSAVLPSGGSDRTLDFGFIQPVAVGDFVWNDVDKDGEQDANEPGIQGVTVTISRDDGEPVKTVKGATVTTTQTDATGHYLFDDLEPNVSYTVTVTNPDETTYAPTQPGKAGGDTEKDSSTGSATTAVLGDGEIDRSLDFGFIVQAASVGDFVWDDLDRDGVQDDGEPGIAGVQVTLVGPDDQPVDDVFGNPVDPATTGANGKYLFTNLPTLAARQHYTVRVDNGQAALNGKGYIPTSAGRGTPSTDSSTGSAESRDLTSDGDADLTLDFGFIRPAVSVGDFVWVDSNGNGIQDAGEPGIPNVAVTITGPNGAKVNDTDGNPVTAATTDADGRYRFTNLPALPAGSHYTVHVDNAQSVLAAYVPTMPTMGTDRAKDSSTGDAVSADVTTDGDADTTLDFGYVDPVSVGDFVWEDLNGNGVQDTNEPGVAGATVTLVQLDAGGAPVPGSVKDVNGNTVAPVTTVGDGSYTFGNLYPGNYRVELTAPAGYTATVAGAGTDRMADSSTGHADTMALQSGQNDPTLDFGLVRPVTMGDFVWNDVDRDGIQDAGEPGIQGVVLTIANADGTAARHPDGTALTTAEATTATDADGKYTFGNLAPGTYTVSAQTPTQADGVDYLPTVTQTGNRNTDSSTGSATSRTITSGLSDITLDFGFVVPAVSVGDFVWNDLDRDGVQDAGEPGIDGVEASLTGPDGKGVTDVYGKPVGTATTDGNGRYAFASLPALPAGQHYTVSVDGSQSRLAGLVPTKQGAHGGAGAADSSTGSATSTGLTGNGDTDPTLDFGFIRPAVAVGDFVWVDSDGDGVQDADEPGIQGVQVTLVGPDGKAVTDVDGNQVGPQATDADGHYLFTGLPALAAGKSYTVEVDNTQSALAAYAPTRAGAGSDRGVDSSTATAASGDLTDDGDSDRTLDFGYVKPVRVGNFVWVDSNGNGIQDTGEPGLAGVTLKLTTVGGDPVTDVDGKPLPPVTTTADGYYVFLRLQPGTYVVVVTDTPAGFAPTRAGAGTDTTVDSSTGSATTIAIRSGGTDRTLDFGFVQPVTVGNFVWEDLDGNGVQDTGEPGIAGVTVTLVALDANGDPVAGAVRDVNGDPVAPQQTGDQGKYSFTNLPPGRYRVQATTPAGYVATRAGVGDADTDSSTGSADSRTLPSGATDTTLDFGFLRPVTVGDFVWEDRDANGVQNAGEPGIPGVAVTIRRADGSPVLAADGTELTTAQLTTNTDADGHYAFTDLAPGRYVVTVTAPDGYYSTPAGAGSDAGRDSSTGSAQSSPLASGGNDRTLDFGFFVAAEVGDYVWNDTNRDGVQQPGEPGIAGVTVTLTDTDGKPVVRADGTTVTATRTDANGKYLFTGLVPGVRYVAHVDAGQSALTKYLPTKAGAGDDRTVDSSKGEATSVQLVSNGQDLTLDFGFYSRSVTVGDFVWNDMDGDGRQGKDEPGIAGVSVRLVGPDGKAVTDIFGHPVAPMTTDDTGHYQFADLPALAAGEHYTVSVDTAASGPALKGFVPTRTGVGPTATDSSSGSATSGELTGDGDADLTLDFGFVRPVEVGELVYLDANGNGKFDAGDKGLAGVTVTLTDAAGNPVTDVYGNPVGPVLTDSDGDFVFDNLPPGDYTVHVDNDQPALDPYRPTKSGAGSSNGVAASGTLPSGTGNLGLAFGFVTKTGTPTPAPSGTGGAAPSSGVFTPNPGGGIPGIPGSGGNGGGTGSPADTGIHSLGNQILLGVVLAALGALLLLGTRRRRRN